LVFITQPFRGNSSYWQVSQEEAGLLISKRRYGIEKGQKEPGETIKETSGLVRPEWVNKRPKSMLPR
jgi:hypothetical protein